MFHTPFSHKAAVLAALFVAFLWSTSWVLIKWGLRDIPALTFAGLRYVLASLCLLPFVLRQPHVAALRRIPGRQWARLAIFGLISITVAQGAQFLGLKYLPAVTVSLLLNFTPVVVALMGIALLAERPTVRQWAGVLLYLTGIAVYFYPIALPTNQVLGIIIVAVGVLFNAGSSIMGRQINREEMVGPLVVTTISMSIGAVVLLAMGLLIEGMPTVSPTNWAFIAWLAVVNTAFAFTLWNHVQRTLSAIESSIINSTMLVQIAILAWLFLGETLTIQDIAGMALVTVGTLVVQLRRG
ncbi:MAG TPA: DMT family transporter [Chloroflexia bacterium]|nr:DMT family transporter [Chloroflexia bacterium]